MKLHPLTDRQHATVIAALRLYQTVNFGDRDDSGVHALATKGGTVEPLADGEIDDLCGILEFDGVDGPPREYTAEEAAAEAFQGLIEDGILSEEAEEEDDGRCECGASTDDGEGYDGLCGPCADRQVAIDSKRGIHANVCRLDRDAIAEILETHGIQCYDHEDKETLATALTENICDDTIPHSVLDD